MLSDSPNMISILKGIFPNAIAVQRDEHPDTDSDYLVFFSLDNFSLSNEARLLLEKLGLYIWNTKYDKGINRIQSRITTIRDLGTL